jgi:hypothetical protein
MMFLQVEGCHDLLIGSCINTLFKITSLYYRELFGKWESWLTLSDLKAGDMAGILLWSYLEESLKL